MTSLRLHSKALRIILAVGLACLGLAAGTSFAASSSSAPFVVGSSELNSSQASSSQEYKADGHRILKCPSGAYISAIREIDGWFGTYTSVQFLMIYCTLPGGTQDSGTGFGGVAFPGPPVDGGGYTGKCTGTNAALTRLNVNSDHFIKDIELGCAEIYPESGKDPSFTHHSYGDWVYGKEEKNDVQKGLSCSSEQVVHGLYIGYREDSAGTTAFTSIQLYCSDVSAAPTTSTTTSTTKHTTTTHTITVNTTIPRVTTIRTTTTTPKPITPPATTTPHTTTTTTAHLTTTTPKLPTTTTTTRSTSTTTTTTVHK